MPVFSVIGYTLTALFRKPDIWQQIYKQRRSTFMHQTMNLKRVEKKKILVRHNKVAKWLSNYFEKKQTQPSEVSIKKLFYLIQNIAKFLRAPILKNIFERLLLKLCLWNREKLKIIHKEFKLYIKKTGFFNIIRNKWKRLFLFHNWFPMKFVFAYNISLVWWETNSKH